jgi:mono/diheme cytochrome c family protein
MASNLRPDEQPPIPDNSPDAPDYQAEHDIMGMHAALAREKQDPRDGMEPIPLWLIAFCCLVVFWAGSYLFTFSGAFRGDVFTAVAFGGGTGAGKPGASAATGGDAAAGSAPKELTPEQVLTLGKKFYTQNCVACHQTTGLGVAGANPPLAGSDIVTGDERRLAAIMLHGLKGPIVLNNQKSTWSGNMVSWAQLGDNRIAYILTYIRQEWGNGAPPVSIETVTQVRTDTAGRATQWTWDELEQFK